MVSLPLRLWLELQQQGKPLKSGDILLDWGCGAGMWLCFARQLLGVRGMVGLGIEEEKSLHDICQENIKGIALTSILHESSETFDSFCPARLVVNYDGGFQSYARDC